MSPSNASNGQLVYFNGIDPDTGTYALPPASLDDLAKRVRVRPATAQVSRHVRFAVPFGVDMTDLSDAGWGIVFAEETPQEVRDALAPLLEQRRKQAGALFHILDCKKNEQIRDWYLRHGVSAGNFEPTRVPYYLLLIGPPTGIPFEFQFLLDVEYAVGRLSFDRAEDYARYAASIVAYENAAELKNGKEIVYWGTQHPGDPATNLSASLLIDPLANGVPEATGYLKVPVHAKVGYTRRLFRGDEATRAALLTTLGQEKPPALLFTASHGMAVKSGKPNQTSDNGALICQDWPGFGSVKRDQYLAGADVGDNANVRGMIAFLFACYSAGTPDVDQFLSDLSQAGAAPLEAPQPFVAALPRRLLAHPAGSVLAVIAHIDRAWGFSIQPPKMNEAQIGTFHHTLSFLLTGCPVGHAVSQQFGQRFSALSVLLLNALSPTTPEFGRLTDRELVTYWLERNDAQNYVVLGDPAVRIRNSLLH